MITQQNEVALFIDFENIHTSVRNSNLGANFVDWRLILDAIEPLGRIAIRRAYSDWAENARHQDALARYGIESRNAFGRGKNVSDIFLAVEAMETLCSSPNVQTYILVSGDGDFSVMVHRLRNHHKQVIGIGVHGTTSQGLVEACDDYIFYDELLREQQRVSAESLAGERQREQAAIAALKAAQPVRESRPVEKPEKPEKAEKPEKQPRQQNNRRQKPEQPKPIEEPNLTSLGELLERALPEDGSWINGATLIYRLRGLNRGFDKEMQQQGFQRFRDFLEAFTGIVELRSAPGKGHMEARRRGLLSSAESVPVEAVLPEVETYTVEDYLNVLEQLRPRVTPNTHRPNLILRIHKLMVEQQPPTLNKLKVLAVKELQTYLDIDEALIEEVIHQLYHTYSFEFERMSDVPQWDRPCRFQPHIHTALELLDNCDLGLLRRLRRGLPDSIEFDPHIIAYILYGMADNPRIMERTASILQRLNEEDENTDD